MGRTKKVPKKVVKSESTAKKVEDASEEEEDQISNEGEPL